MRGRAAQRLRLASSRGRNSSLPPFRFLPGSSEQGEGSWRAAPLAAFFGLAARGTGTAVGVSEWPFQWEGPEGATEGSSLDWGGLSPGVVEASFWLVSRCGVGEMGW